MEYGEAEKILLSGGIVTVKLTGRKYKMVDGVLYYQHKEKWLKSILGIKTIEKEIFE